MMIIIGIPLEMMIGYVTDEYAAKRPNLQKWGLNTEHWIGSNGDARIGKKGPSSTMIDLFQSLGKHAQLHWMSMAEALLDRYYFRE
jgi:hypothetical protein